MINKRVQDIELAFCKLLQKTEFKKITVSMICRDAGISRATFYTYFESIQALKEELEERTLADVLDILGGWEYFSFRSVGEGNTAPVFIDICRYCANHREVFRALFGPNGDQEFVFRYESYMYQDFMRHIEAEGNIRFPELIASSCAGAVIGLTRTWMVNQNMATTEELAQLHTAIIYRIIRSTDRFSQRLTQKKEGDSSAGSENGKDLGWQWRSCGVVFGPTKKDK